MRVYRTPLKSSGGPQWTHRFSQVPTKAQGEEEGEWVTAARAEAVNAALKVAARGCDEGFGLQFEHDLREALAEMRLGRR